MGVTYLADVFHFEVTVVQIQFDHSGKDDNNNLHRTAYESKKKLLNLWNVDDSNVLHHLCKKKPVNFSDFNYPLSASQRRRVRSSSGELLERRVKFHRWRGVIGSVRQKSIWDEGQGGEQGVILVLQRNHLTTAFHRNTSTLQPNQFQIGSESIIVWSLLIIIITWCIWIHGIFSWYINCASSE